MGYKDKRYRTITHEKGKGINPVIQWLAKSIIKKYYLPTILIPI